MLHASMLLGLAFRIAQQLGVHRDGTNFNLTPWQIESRRRLWHHMVLLDTWALENHGLDTIFREGVSDTALPQNSDDAAWDTSEFSATCPKPQNKPTDMTFALVQYELGSLVRFVLNNSIPSPGRTQFYRAFHAQVARQAQVRLGQTYMKTLDRTHILQRLTRDLADLAFKRIALMQLQPVLSVKDSNDQANIDLEAKYVFFLFR